MHLQFDGAKRLAFLVGWIAMTSVFVLLSPVLYRMFAAGSAPARVMDDDDGSAIVAAFGPPDEDFVAGGRSGDGFDRTRFMVYRARDVRIALVQRRTSHGAVWKVVGPADAAGRVILSGGEALRRLKGLR